VFYIYSKKVEGVKNKKEIINKDVVEEIKDEINKLKKYTDDDIISR